MKNQGYFINGFPDYRLIRLSESKFCVLSKKKGYWEEIGNDRGDGHIQLRLYEDGVKKETYLHVLVAEMFVPNPEGKDVVHHIDGDATNNNPSNLIWLTISEHAKIHMEGEKHPNYGKHRAEETRRKLSEANKGKHHTEETRRKLSETISGEKHPMYGKHHTEESKRKMSEAKPKKSVLQYTKDGVFVAKYPSLREAERQTVISSRNISSCCSGNKKSAGGYKWEYAA